MKWNRYIEYIYTTILGHDNNIITVLKQVGNIPTAVKPNLNN